MLQSRQPAANLLTHIVGYDVLMGHDEQQASKFLKKKRQIQTPLIEEWGDEGILRPCSRLQTFLHKMKFPG